MTIKCLPCPEKNKDKYAGKENWYFPSTCQHHHLCGMCGAVIIVGKPRSQALRLRLLPRDSYPCSRFIRVGRLEHRELEGHDSSLLHARPHWASAPEGSKEPGCLSQGLCQFPGAAWGRWQWRTGVIIASCEPDPVRSALHALSLWILVMTTMGVVLLKLHFTDEKTKAQWGDHTI